MCRVTKRYNFLLLSAGKEQLKAQFQLQFCAFNKEPPKNIFYDPVVVLDFQSLYPSIIMAYNICYSTCLGRIFDQTEIEKHKNIDEEGKYKKYYYYFLIN